MRASVMMFLPSLTKRGKIPALIKALEQKRMTVRGIYGEGSESEGYLYQISNKISLGFSEEEIVSAVSKAVEQICKMEILVSLFFKFWLTVHLDHYFGLKIDSYQ